MYYLNVKLQSICMVSLAKTFWEIQQVKTLIRDFFNKDASLEKKDWYSQITRNVLSCSQVLTEKLPSKLKTELDDFIVFIGDEIYMWTEYLVKKLKLAYDFAEVIYFNPFGLIDEAQIFRKYWQVNKNKLFRNVTIYSLNELACIFMVEDFIFESKNDFIHEWEKIFLNARIPKKLIAKHLSLLGNKIGKLKKKDDVIMALVSTWINLRYRLLYNDFDVNLKGERYFDLEKERFENKKIEIKTQMLAVCLEEYMPVTFKFFFKRNVAFYKDFIDQYVILKSRKICKSKDTTDYERKKYFEVALLVINEISDDQKCVMIVNHHEALIKWALDNWPYQEFFLRIIAISNCWQLMSEIKERKKLVMFLVEKDQDDHKMKCPIKRNLYNKLLKDLWAVENKYLSENSFWHNQIVTKYIEIGNFRAVRILASCDKEFKEKGFIEHFYDIHLQIYDWIKNENFELLEKFYNEAFETDAERDELKKSLKNEVIQCYIYDGEYSELDKALNYFEKLGMNLTKNDIDGFWAVESLFLAGNIGRIDKFLHWFCDSDAEIIKEIKERFKSDEKSIRKCIIEIFAGNMPTPESMKEQGTAFLNFFFDSDQSEIKNFKINILLKDENDVIDFALHCDDNKYDKSNIRSVTSNFFPIKNLLEFCELPSEKIEDLKKKCLDNFERLSDLYTEKCNSFIVFDQVINWIVNKSSGRKQRLIKRFMKTPNSILMTNKIINKGVCSLEENLQNIILKYYNTWMKGCKNIPTIKKEIEKLNEEKLTKDIKVKLSMMFSKLEKGETLASHQIVSLGKHECDDTDDIDDDGSDPGDHGFDSNSDGSSDDSSDSSDSIGRPDGYIKDIFRLINGIGGLTGINYKPSETDSDDSDF